MSQCVPSRDLFNYSSFSFPIGYHHPALGSAAQLQMADTESVAELTWHNGQLAMQGLSHQVITKPIPKYPSAAAATWEKPGPSGTLESLINQATRSQLSKELSSWPTSVTADALVPCSDADRVPYQPLVPCSDADRVPYPPRHMKRPKLPETGINCASQGSCAPMTGKGESTIVTLDNTWADDMGFTANSASPEEVGFTTTSASPEGGGSPETENTSFGGGRPTTTLDDHDSFCHSLRSLQRDGVGEEDEKVSKEETGRSAVCPKRRRASRDRVGEEDENVSKGETGRSAICMKRRRASAIHNQSERKRRDKINERMKALQKMVPNSSKTDKASMLDEVIEYLKTLQAQVQMMNRMSSMSQLMMPMPMAAMAQYQMSMLANIAQMSQMGMGIGMGMMDINPLAQGGHPGLPSILHPPASLHPWGAANDRIPPTVAATAAIADPFSAFLPGATQQPMGVDAFNRMGAMYQQLYQQAPQPIPKP